MMSAIQKQWDIGVTSIASVDKLLEVIRAGSEDNVQAQAVLALQALGSAIHPPQELIGKGVDALGGVDNVKIQNMKLVVGLHSGGTAMYLRQSTPGIAAFLLISALKLWHTDDDVGETLHRMAIVSGVISRWPASARQFSQVVDAVSGNARTILPVQHLYHTGHAILSSNLDQPVQQLLYRHISKQAAAEILAHVFAGLQDEDVAKLSLAGAASSPWLIAVLTWIAPDSVSVLSGSHTLIGSPEARLTIELKVPGTNDLDWQFTEWKKETSLTSLITTAEGATGHPPLYIPRFSAKHHFQSAYNLSSKGIAIMGQIAGAFLCMLVEKGRLRHWNAPSAIHDESGLRSYSSETETTTTHPFLSQVASDWFCKEYSFIVRRFGWSDSELSPGQRNFYEILEGWSVQDMCDDDPCSTSFGVMEKHLIPGIRDAMRELYGPWNESSEQYDCIEHAIDIAVNALALMTWTALPKFNGIELTGMMGSTSGYESMLTQLLTPMGMVASEFRQELIRFTLPNYTGVQGHELILEQNGLVLYPSIILDPTCDRKAALGHVLTLGSIRRDGERYSLVTDFNYGTSHMREVPKEGNLQPFKNGKYVGLMPESDLHRTDIEVSSDIQGTTIAVRTLLKIRSKTSFRPDNRAKTVAKRDLDQFIERDFSWLQALENLATAVHLDGMDALTRRGEENLARRMFNAGKFSSIYWIPAYGGHYFEDDSRAQRLVARTCQDPILSLYQLSSQSDLKPIVRHNCSLVTSIATANELGEKWVIIT